MTVTQMSHVRTTAFCTKLCCGVPLVTLPGVVHPPWAGSNSPYGPVSSGPDGAQRRVSQRDFPRRFLHLEPVEARPGGGGLVLRRLHGPLSVSRPSASRNTAGLSTCQVRSDRAGESSARIGRLPPGHVTEGRHPAVKTCGRLRSGETTGAQIKITNPLK